MDSSSAPASPVAAAASTVEGLIRVRVFSDSWAAPLKGLNEYRAAVSSAQKISQEWAATQKNLKDTHILGSPESITVFKRNMS